MLTIHRWSATRAVPWKNGGGITRELARHPENDPFHWRLSVAEVASDGPFSEFPGVDRLIALIDGAGMDLKFVDEAVSVPLRPPLGWHRFAGESTVYATLPAGPTTDLNLMWRRDLYDASLRVLEAPVGYDPVGRRMLVFVAAGNPTLGDGTSLMVGDAVETDGGVNLGGTGTVMVFVLDPR